MNSYSPESTADVQHPTVSASPAARTSLILTAWIATLLLSKLPLVIARDVLGIDIPWILPSWIILSLALAAATTVWPLIRPLRAFFIVFAAIYLAALADPWLRQMALWQGVFANNSPLMAVFGDRVLLLLETLFVLAVLLGLGIRRKQAYLTRGDLSAPLGGRPEGNSSGKRRGIPWSIFGPVIALLLGAMFFSFLMSQLPGGFSNLSNTLPWLPLILVSAVMNAFGEEATFRAAPLATLVPVIGPNHALWMTAMWFGLGHYYGGFPSGPAGLVQAGLLGLLMGKAMLDTRGIAWPWFIHAVIDTAIYTYMAASVLR